MKAWRKRGEPSSNDANEDNKRNNPSSAFEEEERVTSERDEDHEGVEGEENHDDGGEEEEEKPKLDEGFYEIEDFRRKRVRKGQVQYLVKWRGWPEAANTWEPADNLQLCSDMIAAFEERLGKHGPGRPSRKRKRKFGASSIQPKKKQLRNYNLSGDKDGPHSSEPLTSASLDNSNPSESPSPNMTESSNAVESKNHVDGDMNHVNNVNGSTNIFIKEGETKDNNVDIVEEPNVNGFTNIFLEAGETKDNNDVETAEELNVNGSVDIFLKEGEAKETREALPRLSDLKLAPGGVNDESISIPLPETLISSKYDLTNGLSTVEYAEPALSNRSMGAKRRKSGSVRRFKNDSAPCEPDKAQNVVAQNITDSGLGAEKAGSKADDTGAGNQLDMRTNLSSIVKIIKPISYLTSISNNTQDVSVTFSAMRYVFC
ncbi:hypothetical protein GIB67_032565 [Kingdonia uniflora]|uniref:Chromo domain-containing protein n=1 Tax=Kingdonia uniflora TaxID=39325 RepID=A0A7J7LSC1_9MAGN|nr:hypothetical protein GIB67_032565 [Kingdonia uniflora]